MGVRLPSVVALLVRGLWRLALPLTIFFGAGAAFALPLTFIFSSGCLPAIITWYASGFGWDLCAKREVEGELGGTPDVAALEAAATLFLSLGRAGGGAFFACITVAVEGFLLDDLSSGFLGDL
jgi:hypothetical protein